MPHAPIGSRRTIASHRAPRRPAWAVIVIGVAVLAAALGVLAVPHLVDGATAPSADAAEPTPRPSSSRIGTLTPGPAALAIDDTLIVPGAAPSLPWPRSGQARVMIGGSGDLGYSGGAKPVPIASVTKVMTAYTVLRDHPLGRGRAGPMLTVTAGQAAAYPAQRARLESLVRVGAGERITERDALEGLLIASGDNLAEILARWDAGSVSAFVRRMNANARRLGMTSTHYEDPAGLSASSVSTAADLLRLAPVAMAEPALAEIVGLPTASIPLNSTLSNYNTLLGRHGIYGIKTGSTSVAGGCLLFVAHRTVSGHPVTVYGVVLGISGTRSTILPNALAAADALVVGAGRAVHRIVLLRAGQTLASVVDEHGTPVQLTVAKTVTVTGWPGQRFGFALPAGLGVGQVPAELEIATPAGVLAVALIEKQ